MVAFTPVEDFENVEGLISYQKFLKALEVKFLAEVEASRRRGASAGDDGPRGSGMNAPAVVPGAVADAEVVPHPHQQAVEQASATGTAADQPDEINAVSSMYDNTLETLLQLYENELSDTAKSLHSIREQFLSKQKTNTRNQVKKWLVKSKRFTKNEILLTMTKLEAMKIPYNEDIIRHYLEIRALAVNAFNKKNALGVGATSGAGRASAREATEGRLLQLGNVVIEVCDAYHRKTSGQQKQDDSSPSSAAPWGKFQHGQHSVGGATGGSTTQNTGMPFGFATVVAAAATHQKQDQQNNANKQEPQLAFDSLLRSNLLQVEYEYGAVSSAEHNSGDESPTSPQNENKNHYNEHHLKIRKILVPVWLLKEVLTTQEIYLFSKTQIHTILCLLPIASELPSQEQQSKLRTSSTTGSGSSTLGYADILQFLFLTEICAEEFFTLNSQGQLQFSTSNGNKRFAMHNDSQQSGPNKAVSINAPLIRSTAVGNAMANGEGATSNNGANGGMTSSGNAAIMSQPVVQNVQLTEQKQQQEILERDILQLNFNKKFIDIETLLQLREQLEACFISMGTTSDGGGTSTTAGLISQEKQKLLAKAEVRGFIAQAPFYSVLSEEQSGAAGISNTVVPQDQKDMEILWADFVKEELQRLWEFRQSSCFAEYEFVAQMATSSGVLLNVDTSGSDDVDEQSNCLWKRIQEKINAPSSSTSSSPLSYTDFVSQSLFHSKNIFKGGSKIGEGAAGQEHDGEQGTKITQRYQENKLADLYNTFLALAPSLAKTNPRGGEDDHYASSPEHGGIADPFAQRFLNKNGSTALSQSEFMQNGMTNPNAGTTRRMSIGAGQRRGSLLGGKNNNNLTQDHDDLLLDAASTSGTATNTTATGGQRRGSMGMLDQGRRVSVGGVNNSLSLMQGGGGAAGGQHGQQQFQNGGGRRQSAGLISTARRGSMHS
ncbi:unnamed protein product [Amoebophrya sp. A120]|nr:unnamed protein product [Amoebophrya sp. A120]|eukprot:GSA120T00009718001.1